MFPVLDRYVASRKVAGGESEFRVPRSAPVPTTRCFNITWEFQPEYRVWRRGRRRSVPLNYDSYDHFVRFIDPDFQYVMATAQLGGRMVLRMANAEWLPFQVEPTSRAVRAWTTEVIKLADTCGPRRRSETN